MENGTPAWVSEGSLHKYNRAVAQLKKLGQPFTEEDVKKLYVSWNGLLLEVKALKVEEKVEEEEVDEQPAPARRGRPAKTEDAE